MTAADNLDFVSIAPGAAQCLINERRRFVRKQTTGKAYQRQKAKQRAQYAEAKAKREPLPKANAKPWNDLKGELVLHLCDSVRAQLPAWSPYR